MQPVLTFLFYLGEKSRSSISWSSPLTVKANYSSRGCGQPWPKTAGPLRYHGGLPGAKGAEMPCPPHAPLEVLTDLLLRPAFLGGNRTRMDVSSQETRLPNQVKEQRGRNAIYQLHQWAQAGGGGEAFPPFRPLPTSANRLSNPPAPTPQKHHKFLKCFNF